jgi:Arc/MetJ-type ribon-helix-helix transcriptional regulator
MRGTMSKITFRADDDLVRRLEEFDASKSEVMREALRAYLDAERDTDAGTEESTDPEPGSIDAALSDRIDELLADRLDARNPPRRQRAPEFNVNVTLDGVPAQNADASVEPTTEEATRKTRPANADDRGDDTPESSSTTCGQCGETMSGEHVYCPNCGEKATHRVFCDCGDELRSDWAFCPGCGRRTPAADVLERS